MNRLTPIRATIVPKCFRSQSNTGKFVVFSVKFLLPANKSDIRFVSNVFPSMAIDVADSDLGSQIRQRPEVPANHMIARDLRLARNLRHCALHFLFRLF